MSATRTARATSAERTEKADGAVGAVGAAGAVGEGERLPQPATADIDLVTVLHALGDPVRLTLLLSYADDAEHSCDPRGLGLEHLHKSTVSHHMRVLREAGITTTRVAGRNRFVRLRRADLDTRFPGLLDALLAAASTHPGEAGAAP